MNHPTNPKIAARYHVRRWLVAIMLGLLGSNFVSSSHARPPPPRDAIGVILIGPQDQLIVHTLTGVFVSSNQKPEWSPIEVSKEGSWGGIVYWFYTDAPNAINGPGGGTQKILWRQKNVAQATGKADRYFCNSKRLIMRSTDGGVNWITMGKAPGNILCRINIVGGTLYVGTEQGLYKSENHGVNWVAATDADVVQRAAVRSIFVNSKGHLYVNSEHHDLVDLWGTYKSVDGGKTWGQLDFGISGFRAGNRPQIVAIINDVIYASSHIGLISSKTDGKDWAAADAGMRKPMRSFDLDLVAEVQQSQSGMFYAHTRAAIYKRARETDVWQAISLKGLSDGRGGAVWDHD